MVLLKNLHLAKDPGTTDSSTARGRGRPARPQRHQVQIGGTAILHAGKPLDRPRYNDLNTFAVC